MRSQITTALLAAAALVVVSNTAHACPAGYKRVTIQGHSICQLDASASQTLKAPTKAGGAASSTRLAR